MLHTYLTAKVARHIVAFLFMGSAMGFVLGQQLGHRPTSAALHVTTPRSAVVAQHARGGLDTPAAQPVHGVPVAQRASAPTQRESHARKDKHEKDGDSGGHGDSGDSGGHGHSGGGDGGGGKGGGGGGGGA
jgi:uncharacterized membrane protein YgcG